VGNTPRADQITRFDFDGDFVGNNNSAHLLDFNEPAYVYYNVIESETHYFIMYCFYHVKDYKNVFGHENDLEGTLIVVEKDGTRFGKPVYAETLAHDEIYSYSRPVLVNDREGPHRVALNVEAKGHGVHSWNSLSDLTAWLQTNPKDFVYFFGGHADDPTGKTQGLFSYDLLSVKTEMWDRKDGPQAQDMFGSRFDYNGKRFTLKNLPSQFHAHGKLGTPRPPWAWIDTTDTGSVRGDWFFDPALFVQRHFHATNNFSLNYVYNPYVPHGD
jgi:hypothetical protein